jgi:hypothetical protein
VANVTGILMAGLVQERTINMRLYAGGLLRIGPAEVADAEKQFNFVLRRELR